MGVGRLAPSPTGAQHLGNARTYLLAYLAARSQGDRIVMRIEDVDSPRVKPWAVDQAIEDLRWLGLDWDEGPDVGGDHAPYIQTQRMSSYNDTIEQLTKSNMIYPCTCTRKDILEAGSAPHFEHELPVYSGRCAAWKSGDAVPESGTYCWRFRASNQEAVFGDRMLGRKACVVATALGDFPVTQKNGNPSYQLAVVVDDVAMGITQVVRGDDLVTSTFRQIELYRALGKTPPEFSHVPLVCGEDGRRLAKRHGDTRLSQYREQGIAPEAIVGWAAFTSGLIEANELVAAADLIEEFAWEKINPNSVINSFET